MIKIGKEQTLKQLKDILEKEIKIRTKDSKVSLDKDLEKGFCTSYQSTVCIKSIMSGVLVFV